MCVTVCGKLGPNEGGVVGYGPNEGQISCKAGHADDGNIFSNTLQVHGFCETKGLVAKWG